MDNEPAGAPRCAAIIAAATPNGHEKALVIGVGDGLLALTLAAEVAHVTAVDPAPNSLTALDLAARRRRQTNVMSLVADPRSYDATSKSFDLVVSSYEFHDLADRDKVAFLSSAHRWLRPNGKLVIADQMFAQTERAEGRADRQSGGSEAPRGGVASLWRNARNVLRLRPLPGPVRQADADFWQQQATLAGFRVLSCQRLGARAGVLVVGIGPAGAARPPARGRPCDMG